MHSTSPSLLLVTLLAGGLSLGTHHGAAPMAAELPADTNAIHTLTKAQAELLAERTCQLSLDGLTSLDAEAAKALAEFRGNGAAGLSLGGFTTLDADTAKAIAQFKAAFMSLSGLTTLDADTAKNLAGFRGSHGLVLNGLTKLDADTAKALAQFQGKELHLNGLTSLDTDVAKALSALRGNVFFSTTLRGKALADNTLTPDTALGCALILASSAESVGEIRLR
jgi:hypothetical protein